MPTRSAAYFIAVLGLASCFSLACFKSSTSQASFESSSDSSSSPFRSSSSSSPDDDEQTEDDAYRRDVQDYASSFDATGDDTRVFQRDLSEIAETHGFMDWESHEGTYLAIGRGLAGANLDDRRFRKLAVELANEDFGRLALLQAGFEAGREGARTR